MASALLRGSPLLMTLLLGACAGAGAGAAMVLTPAQPHELVVLDVDDPELWVDETSTLTQRIRPGGFFMEVLPSWNLNVPEGCGAVVEMQVGRATNGSPWMWMGDWGKVPDVKRKVRCPRGGVLVDHFQGFDSAFLWVRIRVRTFGFEAPRKELVSSLTLSFSDRREGIETLPPTRDPKTEPVAVPAIKQGSVPRPLSARVCSPASVAMVLGAFGKKPPLEEVIQRTHDAHHDLYGIWPRNVQVAWSYGVPGYIEQINSWDRVLELTESGRLLVISIKAKKGELSGAMYSETDGHLIVIRGLLDRDRVAVMDPAGGEKVAAERVYSRADLETVWMKNGGVAYVLGAAQ